jgi:hypothetical protein
MRSIADLKHLLSDLETLNNARIEINVVNSAVLPNEKLDALFQKSKT